MGIKGSGSVDNGKRIEVKNLRVEIERIGNIRNGMRFIRVKWWKVIGGCFWGEERGK